MSKAQISSASFISNSQLQNSHISANIPINLKKQKQHIQDIQVSKQNQSKHMNAIKPYVQGVKQRKISKRQSQKNLPISSPYMQQSNHLIYPYQSMSKSKSKKGQSLKKIGQQCVGNKNIGDLYTELINIKSEYKSLKNSYNGLLKQHSQLTVRGQCEAANIIDLKKQLQKVRRQQQKNKNNLKFMEHQMERMKKQCVRMVQSQKFKNKKLQETIQQKELMIAYLRSQLAILNGQTNINTGFFFQHTAPTYLRSSNIQNNGTNQNQNKQQQIINRLYQNNNISNINVPEHNPNQISNIGSRVYNGNNISKINKSIINNSAISSIENISVLAGPQLIDFPRQMNTKKGNHQHPQKQTQNNKFILNSIIKKPQQIQNFDIKNKNKREYIFSNQDDSLSFSYEKSKQSIKQQDYDSMQSQDPTVLTFTKKDVYVLEQQQFNKNKFNNFQQEDRKRNYNSIVIQQNNSEYRDIKSCNQININNIKAKKQQSFSENEQYEQNQYQNDSNQQANTNQQKQRYTGEQEIMTFQNRYANKEREDIIKITKNQKQRKKIQQKMQKSQKHKIKLKDKFTHRNNNQNSHQNQKKQVYSKGRLLTKRLQINTDQIGLAEDKQSSAETRKRPTTQATNSKTGKKKFSRKRKSEQSGSIIKKST